MMSKTKELLDDLNYRRDDGLFDAEYEEWVYYTQLPYITHKDKDESKDENKDDNLNN